MSHDAGGRVDREVHDLLGAIVGDVLDIDAAFGGDHERHFGGLAIDQNREIKLLVDVGAFLDIEPVDLLAVRSGLHRDQVAPSICLANSLTSATDLAIRTPPLSPALASLNLPLPRPPAWIWLFTTQTGPGSVFAATSESEARSTGTPFEIGTPNSCSSALAWYS